MKRKSFDDMICPIALSLEKVGEWWSILILRDAWMGKRRFDEFQKSLGIGTSTLTRRLDSLVANGLLKKQPIGEKGLRQEYVLTEAGEDFRKVLEAFVDWGNRYALPDHLKAEASDDKGEGPAS
ncbi:winged helix-turn-helix transcriptional regulator [Paracoccus aminophilus]|uniref:Transcriptional regulator, HxlR family n=1 Tax=Paracoccus aminophilus JCM 7686 TaxID=1367847 RepID=S5XZH1_PARAH|nr:transcriptional regulator, HxlR family [Paracoccus aminophilus JCM 7686]